MTKKELSDAPPRIIRICCGNSVEVGIAGVPFAKKTDITSRDIMGPHTFWGHKDERNGNIYTRRGGFLDMGHLHDCADCTAPHYLLRKPDSLLSKNYELSLKLNFRFPVDSIIPERDDREITQNDFDIFVDFIQTEINKEALRKEEKGIKKEKPDKVKSKKR